MALYLDPITHPNAINVVKIGPYRTPGKAVVGAWARKNEYDVKLGKGTAGASETLKGQPPAEGSITFWAWVPAHFAEWNPILALLKFNPTKGAAASTTATPNGPQQFTIGETKEGSSGGTSSGSIPEPGNTSGKTDGAPAAKSTDPPALSAASAIDIFHPFLADIGVFHVLPPSELGCWEPDGDQGLYKREIKFLEFVQSGAQSIAATPTGSTDGAAPGEPTAGGTEGGAADNGAAGAKGAGTDGQGAWGKS